MNVDVQAFREQVDNMQNAVGRITDVHGFRDGLEHARRYTDTLRRWQGNELMLIVGEVAEAHEELRNGNPADYTYFHVASGEAAAKPEGVPSEIADVVIRCLDFCYAHGIDLGKAIVDKVAYNETRPAMHGKRF